MTVSVVVKPVKPIEYGVPLRLVQGEIPSQTNVAVSVLHVSSTPHTLQGKVSIDARKAREMRLQVDMRFSKEDRRQELISVT